LQLSDTDIVINDTSRSQGSVATHFEYGEIFNHHLLQTTGECMLKKIVNRSTFDKF